MTIAGVHDYANLVMRRPLIRHRLACSSKLAIRAERTAPALPREWLAPRDVTIRLRWRIDAEAILDFESGKNEPYVGQVNDVFGRRRARVGIRGNLTHDGPYVSEIDLPRPK